MLFAIYNVVVMVWSIPILIAGFAVAVSQQKPLSDSIETASNVTGTVNDSALSAERPNIVFIFSDDQDLHMNSLDYMPLLEKYITSQGTTYQKHYCTTAICCPSRASLLTGLNSHNTNVTDVGAPYGGYPKFISQGYNSKYLPIWLQAGGYNTYYTGKLFNAHTVDNYDRPYAAGWTGNEFFLDPYTYAYLKVRTQRNQDAPVDWSGSYATDVLANKTYGFLADAITLQKEEATPFFMMISPTAPHADIGSNGTTPWLMSKPIPAVRHENLFPDAKVPRTLNFNPDEPSSVSWVTKLDKLNETKIEHGDDFYRARLQALQAVDELVEGVVLQLEAAGILNNTYVIYSTDNGYHISQHRLPPGKMCGFSETDSHVPFMMRGPGVPIGKTTDVVTAHLDLAPTFLQMAGIELQPDFDGRAIPYNAEDLSDAETDRQEHVNVEFWGQAIGEGEYPWSLNDQEVGTLLSSTNNNVYGLTRSGFYLGNNTYKSVRVINEAYNLFYTVWCTNERELYDMINDPGQLQNLYPSFIEGVAANSTTLPASLPQLIPRLDALLMVTKSCKAQTCRRPWDVLHPKGDVNSLEDALNTEFDLFYESVGERVAFQKCELGYIIASEGPQESLVYGG